MAQHAVTERKRAPSQRSIAARERIFDAAEQVFSERGFDGASIRDIAARAGVRKANVNFHGGPKEELFERIIARRASELAQARLAALADLEAHEDWRVDDLIAAFITPLLERAFGGDPGWPAYARLIAFVSADPRWEPLARQHFDPIVVQFSNRLATRFPQATATEVASALVYSVSAMLALCTSEWRIAALAGAETEQGGDPIPFLLHFCAAGIKGSLASIPAANLNSSRN